VTGCLACVARNDCNRVRMCALVKKLSAVQEAVLITTICAGWFIVSAVSVVLAGFPQIAGAGYDDAAAISLIVFECIAFCATAVSCAGAAGGCRISCSR